jgi:hypothetical protein
MARLPIRWLASFSDGADFLGYWQLTTDRKFAPLAAQEAIRTSPHQKSDIPNAGGCAARTVITITPSEVLKIARTIKEIPSSFDAVGWLEEKWEEISIVAQQAAKDVIWEALAIGLADHPLVLAERENTQTKSQSKME